MIEHYVCTQVQRAWYLEGQGGSVVAKVGPTSQCTPNFLNTCAFMKTAGISPANQGQSALLGGHTPTSEPVPTAIIQARLEKVASDNCTVHFGTRLCDR